MIRQRRLTIEDLIRLDSLSNAEEYQTAELLFDESQASRSWDIKKVQALVSLKVSLSNAETFGEILSKAVQSKGASNVALAKACGMSEKTLTSLATDSLFPFSVPVMVLKSLILKLGLEPSNTLKAIKLTGEMLAELIDDFSTSLPFVSIAARKEQMSGELRRAAPGATTRQSALDSNAVYLERLREALEQNK